MVLPMRLFRQFFVRFQPFNPTLAGHFALCNFLCTPDLYCRGSQAQVLIACNHRRNLDLLQPNCRSIESSRRNLQVGTRQRNLRDVSYQRSKTGDLHCSALPHRSNRSAQSGSAAWHTPGTLGAHAANHLVLSTFSILN